MSYLLTESNTFYMCVLKKKTVEFIFAWYIRETK